MCLDTGSYMRNFAGCTECNQQDDVKIINRKSTQDETGIELVTYEHVCGNCNHTIAQHQYTFKVEEEFQWREEITFDVTVCRVYHMECLLCGRGIDEEYTTCNPRGPPANAISKRPQ